MQISFLDTFAGIGGFHIGAARAADNLNIELKCVRAVEFDKNACETYFENHGIQAFGDMTKIKPEEFPDHDLLTGGFPCQAFSRNGLVYNFTKRDDGNLLSEDDRSKLCFRLFDVLKVKQPKFFVFENVKEIQSIKNDDGSMFIDTITSSILDCGYDLNIKVMDSVDFGLPQQRKRVYFVGTRKDLGLAGKYEYPRGMKLDCSVEDVLESTVDHKYLLKNLWKNRFIGQEQVSVPQTIENLRIKQVKTNYADALEKYWQGPTHRVSRLEALEIAFKSGEWKTPGAKTNTIVPIAIIYGDTPSGLPRQQDKLYSQWGISPTIATFSTPAFDAAGGWRILTPRECARLQGYDDSFKLPSKGATAYRQVGNAVSTNVAAAVIENLLKLAN